MVMHNECFIHNFVHKKQNSAIERKYKLIGHWKTLWNDFPQVMIGFLLVF